MKQLSVSLCALSLFAFAVGCAAPAEEAGAANTEEGVSSGAQAVPISAEVPAAAAGGGSEWQEIYRGYLSLANQPTYNNPSGSLIRVKVTGCQLASLALSAQDSNLAVTLLPAPAGIGPDGKGGYVGLWRLPYATNLGTISVTANTYVPYPYQRCSAVIEQTTATTPVEPPKPPPSCGTLDEVQCRAEVSCQSIYKQQWVWTGTGNVLQSIFAGCVRR